MLCSSQSPESGEVSEDERVEVDEVSVASMVKYSSTEPNDKTIKDQEHKNGNGAGHEETRCETER